MFENGEEVASVKEALEQRADYISFENISEETSVEGDSFKHAYKELTNKTLRTLVGPRGSGKTHLMRYTWAQCKFDAKKPFAIYVTFNRYFRLEPLRTSKPNPLDLFHSWALSLILISARESALDWGCDERELNEKLQDYNIDPASLRSLISRLERSQPLSEKESELSYNLSIDLVKKVVNYFCGVAGRKFSILLLDDAALTLTPEYLVEFLDIVRSLKTQTIAPKASVYPGTTEYSPRFHAGQDALSINVWHPVDSDDYEYVMDGIAEKRVNSLEEIPSPVVDLFKYAAFGIPRAFLSMLWDYQRRKFRTMQQGVNTIIKEYLDLRIDEYRSLPKKAPKFTTMISHGELVIREMSLLLSEANSVSQLRDKKQISIGVSKDSITSLIKRMFDLLTEAGLVYNQGEIKHGNPERVYVRYVPHMALLINEKVFAPGKRGVSLKKVVDSIKCKSEKHPVRRQLRSLSANSITNLKVDLPECSVCHTSRLSEEQKFCHNCGSELISPSIFTQCCKIKIKDIPGLTEWQRKQIDTSLPKLKTIGDYLAKQDPSSELLTIYGIGKKKALRLLMLLMVLLMSFCHDTRTKWFSGWFRGYN